MDEMIPPGACSCPASAISGVCPSLTRSSQSTTLVQMRAHYVASDLATIICPTLGLHLDIHICVIGSLEYTSVQSRMTGPAIAIGGRGVLDRVAR